jgi:hypothetical protein
MVRPRTVSFEPNEMIALGKEMVQWVKENDPLHLSQWYCIHKGIKFSDWDTMTQRLEFIPYYEQAMRMIGVKYLDKNSNVREGISQRWQRLYFKDLKDDEDQTKVFESKLKSKENESLGENLKGIMDKVAKGEISQK